MSVFGYDFGLMDVLGISSILFYIGTLLLSNIAKLRTFAFLSIINDLVYAVLLNSVPIFAINFTVGVTNTYRLLEERLGRPTIVIIKYLAILCVASAFGYGAYSFYLNPTFNEAMGWVNTFLIIAAFGVKGAKPLRWLFLVSGVIGGFYAYTIGSPYIVFVKGCVFLISAWKLIELHKEKK